MYSELERAPYGGYSAGQISNEVRHFPHAGNDFKMPDTRAEEQTRRLAKKVRPVLATWDASVTGE